mmetsp:Transcript_11986/g.21574  ORF Transcript_11986/g.21574 Transcript_11986/m.21574 type:complete len:229 (+) Transcript_11986:1133-1819(+)
MTRILSMPCRRCVVSWAATTSVTAIQSVSMMSACVSQRPCAVRRTARTCCLERAPTSLSGRQSAATTPPTRQPLWRVCPRCAGGFVKSHRRDASPVKPSWARSKVNTPPAGHSTVLTWRRRCMTCASIRGFEASTIRRFTLFWTASATRTWTKTKTWTRTMTRTKTSMATTACYMSRVSWCLATPSLAVCVILHTIAATMKGCGNSGLWPVRTWPRASSVAARPPVSA